MLINTKSTPCCEDKTLYSTFRLILKPDAMDEEPPMGMLTAQTYKGPASIPHADGDFFAAFFLATNVRMIVCLFFLCYPNLTGILFFMKTALVAHMFPGRVFGSELRARKYE